MPYSAASGVLRSSEMSVTLVSLPFAPSLLDGEPADRLAQAAAHFLQACELLLP